MHHFADGPTLVRAGIMRAISRRGVAHVVLTGGRDGTQLVMKLAHEPVPWNLVHLWWSDERFLPREHPDRNDNQVRDALREMQAAVTHPMPAVGQFEPSNHYSEELANFLGSAPFDVTLLGIGRDGHIASLFADHFDPGDSRAVVEVLDAPKPPPHRISLTISRLNRSRDLFLLATGAEKQHAVKSAVAGDHRLPVGHVSGLESTTLLVGRE